MDDPLDLVQDDIAELDNAGAAGNIIQTYQAVKAGYGVLVSSISNKEHTA